MFWIHSLNIFPGSSAVNLLSDSVQVLSHLGNCVESNPDIAHPPFEDPAASDEIVA